MPTKSSRGSKGGVNNVLYRKMQDSDSPGKQLYVVSLASLCQ